MVLIVPSGIETCIAIFIRIVDFVLIVPSGIETVLPTVLYSNGVLVLIVPSGIETNKRIVRSWLSEVLIVPSGIETRSKDGIKRAIASINCT